MLRPPFQLWLVVCPALAAAAALAPLPGPPEDPAARVFREPVLIARSPSTEGEPLGRVASFGRHQGQGPVYALGLQSTDRATVRRDLGWTSGSRLPGLGGFHRRDDWRYTLTAMRFDAPPDKVPAGELWLPDAEAAAFRPLAVAELDRRSGPTREGARLARLLDEGATTDSWLCWQNALTLAAWLTLPLAVWSVIRASSAGVTKASKVQLSDNLS